jgi:Domain of unknown function (DUF1835)
MPEPFHGGDDRPLNLEQQKKRARELQRALAGRDTDATERFRTSHPGAHALTVDQIVQRFSRLSDAQLVIAREIGLPSWPKLKAHIDRHTSARAAIAEGAAPLDRFPSTVHIRCGNDILDGLRAAGLVGQFIQFGDPYCQGPVPHDGVLLDVRAGFLSEKYEIPIDVARGNLQREYDALAASRHHPRVVLWFEHDSFDQLILARILAFYAEHGSPECLELICVDRFPAVARFHGLGQLSPVALRMLWDERRQVNDEQLELGTRVWEALRQPSPIDLYELSKRSALPHMAAAILRHLQELPWVGNGLGLTEHLTLQMLGEGSASGAQLFRRLGAGMEPLVFLGDTMYWAVLDDMSAADPAPFIVSQDAAHSKKWADRHLDLSDCGRELLAERRDWFDCAPQERWVGGVRIHRSAPPWRWDSTKGGPRLWSP